VTSRALITLGNHHFQDRSAHLHGSSSFVWAPKIETNRRWNILVALGTPEEATEFAPSKIFAANLAEGAFESQFTRLVESNFTLFEFSLADDIFEIHYIHAAGGLSALADRGIATSSFS